MKTDRLELRLDPELRRKLDELVALTGTSASRAVRRLIVSAHEAAFGERRSSNAACPVPPPEAKNIRVVEPDTANASLSTDEILAQAGIEIPSETNTLLATHVRPVGHHHPEGT